MPFQVQLDKENGIIFALYVDTISLGDRISVVETVMESLNTNPQLSVLIDTTNAEDLLTEDEHETFGEFLSERAKAYAQTKVAVSDNNPKKQELAISVAYVGGFNNMVQFSNRTEAIEWLKQR
jgi:hypothetical protein